MRTILIVVWANVKHKKLQSFALAAVFIAVSILFFLAITLFGTTGAYQDLYIESKTSESLIYVKGEDSKDIIINYLENTENILNVNVLANYDHIIETNIKQEDILTPIPDAFFTQYATGEFDQIKIIEGKSADELLLNEVIFSYGKSKLNNVKLGDQIVVNTDQGTTIMSVEGIGVDLTFNFDTITLNRFWTNEATITNLGNTEENYSIGISYINYSAENEQEILDGITMALGDASSDTLILSFQIILQANSFFQIIMGAIFTLIGVILIVVGLFIIRSIIFNNIVTESKKIATLKSTGFSSNNLISMYIFEYGIIAFISIIIGMFASFMLGDVVLSDLNELSNMFGLPNSINVIQMIIVLIIILSIIELTVYLVARNVTKINPAVALSRGVQVNETKAVVSVLKHKKLPLSFILAIKDMMYNKKMMITLVLFIIATSFTIVVLSTASTSLNTQKNNNHLWLGYDVDAKIVNSMPLDLNGHQEILSKLDDSDYVLGTLTVYVDLNSQIYDDNQEKYLTSISQIYVTDDQEILDFNMLDGRIPENEGEVMLGHNMLVALKKEMGDYVTVRTMGVEKELLIVGVSQSLTNQGMTFNLFSDTIKDEFLNNSHIQINFVEDASKEELFIEIERLFGSDMTLIFEKTNASMASMLDVLSVVTTGVISIFSVICLIVLLNLNLTNINKERFNYGIYKSIGMNDQDIINIYLYKNSIINLIGVFIGALMGILLVPSIMNAMTSQLGISEFPTSINYNSVFIAIAIVFAVTFLNAAVVKKNISSIKPKDLLVE
jgi:putative ABC transport system permease protein